MGSVLSEISAIAVDRRRHAPANPEHPRLHPHRLRRSARRPHESRAPGRRPDARAGRAFSSAPGSIFRSNGALAVEVARPSAFRSRPFHSNACGAVVIALVNPRSARWKHRIPLSILSLAAVLEGRHACEFIDGNIDGDVRGTLLRGIRDRDVRYVGFTVMPGPQLAEAIRLTQEIKDARPGVSVIWGGYFATLHTDVVLQSGIVDYVI